MMSEIRRWVEALPPQELNQPVLSVDGKWFTPAEILAEVNAGTELGKRIAAMSLGTDEEMLVQRLKNRLSRYPQDKPLLITLNGGFTPKQILAEVEAGTVKGKQFLETESKYLQYIGELM